MKRVLFISLAVIVALFAASCALFEKPLVKVDGSLVDWGDNLHNDAENDSQWTAKNEIYKAGILFDQKNLYIAGEFTKDGENNFMVIVDLSSVAGAEDTSKHPWPRRYKFQEGDIDFVIETWGENYKAWRFTSENAEEVQGTLASTEADGKKRIEFAIPLNKLGVTDASKLSAKAVFVLTGGADDTKQWAGDFYPDQGFETDNGGYTAPVVITKTVVLESKK